jgi:tRNA 2-(methylsulfanyl)-N6-isopentenyladenosine37 hydroxylase
MLGLKLPTDPRWANLAEKSLDEILTDHAYCEMKAATSCISIIQLFPDKSDIIEALSPIVTEEWGHYRLVIQEINKRKLKLGYQRKDEYVNKLLQFKKKGLSREESLLEKLLTCALIEARSCERFRLLSLHLAEDSLKHFYHQFMVAEANHYRLFLDLAKKHFPERKVNLRWQEYLDFEATMIQSLELRGDRIH